LYDLPALETSLAGSIFAGNLHFLATTSSTNADALAAARPVPPNIAAPHGSVYFADEQTAGRGRGSHSWHSAAGEGLYVSVLLRPQIPAACLPLLPLASGLAAADAIRAVTGLPVDLRWPNDLLIGPRKAGGILVEARNNSEGPPHAVVSHAVVVGIGINVHQRTFAPDLATPATSLDLAVGAAQRGGDRSSSLRCSTGARISRQSLLVALLKLLEQEALALARIDLARKIPARVESASTWVRGRSVSVHGPQACQGVTAGLDENGFLRVLTAAGMVTVQTGGLREIPASSC
jgi:BirA family biotin operon repressor/biotin-[acetyl-CoA-carboxylase] ligase